MKKANYIVGVDCPEYLLIVDKGPWDKFSTITNAVEFVVEELAERLGNRRLEYIDSLGMRDEILVRNGKFLAFKPLR